MKHTALFAALAVAVLLSLADRAHAQQSPRPNIVFIFIDDMGYGDIGPFGNTVNQTPHLDRMAEEGNVLRQFYVSNTACTPSRSALMTGSYAHRIGMDGSVVFPGEKRGLHPEEITIAEILQAKGYATGCFGKWHLGDQLEFLPLQQGFDEYFGIPYSNDMWPGNGKGNPVTKRGPYTPLPIIRQNEAVAYVSDGTDQSLLCEVVTDEAVKFIKKHRKEPFFLYLPHAYVHGPRYARAEIYRKAGGDVDRSNVEEVDTSVGRVLGTLRELGLEKNTLVIFTSDNGGAGGMSMGPLRGGKGGPKYEGHMRVPTVTWWPGTIPAGVETEEIAVTVDILPSLAKLAGASVPDDRTIDGKDVLDILLGRPGAKSPHELHYYEVDAIRRGPWKLIRLRGKVELYNLDEDIGEKNDLAAKHPDLVAELSKLLKAHAERIAADTRPAAFVEDAKPIISEPGRLPRLREFMGMPNLEPSEGQSRPKRKPAAKPASKPVSKPVSKARSKTGARKDAPNVIFILTDDQGYGDLSVHGNPVLKTPKLDALRDESICFTDFHVAPMCTPTRGELMTGFDAFRNGATAVCEGRSMPRRELPMMPKFFKDNGYATGHFGKWHLGDNYPYRPHDRGFDESVHNKAWGIGSLAEHWENDAFDDQYWHNNELKRFDGYNTDVFFQKAMDWIEKQEKPFFVYLATTAAHAPFIVPEKYTRPYLDQGKGVVPNFFGMIANIDENIARLDTFLEKRGLKENTILIFMTDNGTVRGHTVFNAGMRGHKTSEYDGGHRVPFFLRWPAGGYDQRRDIDTLTHSTDLLPSLIDLCGLETGNGSAEFDGQSLRPLLEGNVNALEDRKIVIQYRAKFKRWSGTVLWKKWRLVNGKELYDITTDPGQQKNIYDQRPEVVRTMRDYYERWVTRTTPVMGQTNFLSVGTPHEATTWLSSCNWTGSYADNWGNLGRQNTPGHWDLQVETGGDYRVSMYMFHPEANVPLNGNLRAVKSRPVAQARLLVDGKAITVPTAPGDTHVTFDIQLKRGTRVELEGHFLNDAGKVLSGAFYTFVQKIDADSKTPSVIKYVSVAGIPRR